MNNKTVFVYLVTGYWLLVTLLTGCATAPSHPMLPTYNINGSTYIPLVSLCDLKGINIDYDTFSRSIRLEKDTHQINLLLGSSTVLVNGAVRDLGFPVDIYKDAVVVPNKFKDYLIDILFKDGLTKKPSGISIACSIKRIVIDAGHGGKDPGAIGRSGLREKDVVLDISKRVAHQLESEGKTVYMTRDSDVFIPLPRRAQIANQKNAELFISIHANANRARSLSGLEVYYLSPSVNDVNCALAAAENGTPHLEGASLGGQSQNLKAILWDLVYTDNRSESVELANKICNTMSKNIGLNILGVKGAPFYVLKWTQMPAVLIETGFISNSSEEKMFKSSFYRQQIAEAIAEGINDYCRDFTIAAGL